MKVFGMKLLNKDADEGATQATEVEDTIDVEVEVEDAETEETEEENTEETEVEAKDAKKPVDEEDSTEDDDDVIVTIGDQKPPAEEDDAKAAPEWVRDLRKSHREVMRENRELKAKLEASSKPAEKQVTLGPKPKLSDFDYDADEFEQKLTAWHDTKRKIEAQEAEQKAEQKRQEQAWKDKLDAYGTSKTKLKVKDFDDAESNVLETLNQTQQGIIVQGADNPALVVYALGKNPDRAKELAQIKDPVKFAFTVAKLEKELKVTNRKAPPPPERTVTGTGAKSGTVDSQLERLRAEAAKSGDYTKVHQYKRQLRDKANR